MTENTDPHFDESRIKELPSGRVLEKQRGEYRIFSDNREIICSLRSRLRKSLVFPISRERRQGVDKVRGIMQVDPVAVGDIVRFTLAEDNPGSGVIEFVEERVNQLSRRAPGDKYIEAVICANIDTLFVVFAMKNPAPRAGMIDRFMIAAEWEGINAVLVFNKIDLGGDDILHELEQIYKPTGWKILKTSAVTSEGVDELQSMMQNKTTVLAGPSGTGKSSLLNQIEPGLGLKVSSVSESTGKGKHTTTHLQAFPLRDGGVVLDTPGIKQFALWNLEPYELMSLYPEMEPLIGKCKFGMSCGHDSEPGCVVKQAVKEGRIHPERLKSFLKIYEELDELYGDPYKFNQ